MADLISGEPGRRPEYPRREPVRPLSPAFWIRLSFLAGMLVVPLVGKLFGGPGLFPAVAIFGGVPALIYLFATRTLVGSVVGGLGLVGVTIATEAYVISQWPQSSTAPLGYLWLPFVLFPGVAVLLLFEAFTRNLRVEDSGGPHRPTDPRSWGTLALIGANISATVGVLVVCALDSGVWCWAATGILVASAIALLIRLLRGRRGDAG